MIDQALLDAPEHLARADSEGLLRCVAASGAHVRTAVLATADSELGQLRPEGTPGAILVAGVGPAVSLARDVFDALAGDAVRVSRLPPTGALAAPGALQWPLPRWVGALDLLLIVTPDGAEPGLTQLLEAAHRRGCAVASVAPPGSPLAEATAHRRNLSLPLATAPHVDLPGRLAAPGPHWALLTPLLLLADRLRLFPADPDAVRAMAERLDTVAERCGPAVGSDQNPGKVLATELDRALPLLWGAGPVARAVARHAAATLTGLLGRPALAAQLPEALTAHAGLLHGADLTPGAGPDDFFRDRVEEPEPLRARIVLLHGEPPRHPRTGQPSAAVAARELAVERGLPCSELEPAADSGDLETAAELLAPLDFAAVYLALTAGAAP